MMSPPRITERRKSHGFSLIEAAIVLGVVGLVIGGIWIAASDVTAKQRAQKVSGDVIAIATTAQKLWGLSEIPAACCSSVTRTTAAMDAGVFPSDWISGSSVVSPYGSGTPTGTTLQLGNFATIGIVYVIGIAGREGGYSSGATQSECNYLVTSLGGRFTDNSFLRRIQVWRAAGGSVQYDPPVYAASVHCPSDFTSIQFMFNGYSN